MAKLVVLATSNKGKLREIQPYLIDAGFTLKTQSELNVPEADETGLTFIENAIIKARNASHHAKLPAIADDSGIEVDALDGAPGVLSARYAGLKASDAENNAKLLDALRNTPESQRGARYRCVMVYLRHEYDPAPVICEGVWRGSIALAPRGKGGFGYDPLFNVLDEHLTAAELTAERKHALSHRGRALEKLADALRGM